MSINGIGVGAYFGVYQSNLFDLNSISNLVHWLTVEDLPSPSVRYLANDSWSTPTGGTYLTNTFTEDTLSSKHYLRGPLKEFFAEIILNISQGNIGFGNLGSSSSDKMNNPHDFSVFTDAGNGFVYRNIVNNGSNTDITFRGYQTNLSYSPSVNKPEVTYLGIGSSVVFNNVSYYSEYYSSSWTAKKGGVVFNVVSTARAIAYDLAKNKWSSQSRKSLLAVTANPYSSAVGAWDILHKQSNTIVLIVYQELSANHSTDTNGASAFITFASSSINPGCSCRITNTGSIVTTLGNGSSVYNLNGTRGTATPLTCVTISTEVISASQIRKIIRVYNSNKQVTVTDSGVQSYSVTNAAGSNVNLGVHYNTVMMQIFEYGIYDRVLNSNECDLIAFHLIDKWK